MITKINIYRTHCSNYHRPDFLLREKARLEALTPSLSYQFQDKISALSEDSIIITNTNTNTDFLAKLPKEFLKLVIHPNSGYDNYTPELLKSLNCPIIIGNTIRAQAVAEYILSCLFQHTSMLPLAKKWDVSRSWPRRPLRDLKVLIIGHGHIGQLLVAALKPLVKNLEIYDPFQNKTGLNLQGAEVIIPVPSLNPTSYHLINTSFLLQISKKALIINASRGQVINEQDLIAWLSRNDEAYAYLDVFEREPHNFKSFKHLSNIKLTSHIAGVSKDIDDKIISFEANIIRSFLKGEALCPKAIHLKNKLRENILI